MKDILGSGAIKGIGAALAGKIVKKFKENTFRIIEEEPETTGGNQGNQRTESKRDCFSGGRKERYASGDDLSAEVWNFNDACGERSISIMAVTFIARLRRIRISWRIMFRGLDFKTADEIAAKIGIHTDSDFRIRSGIFYTLQQSVNDGHIYLYQEALLRETSEVAWCSDSGYGTVPDGSCDGKKDCYEAVGAGNEDIYVSLLLYGIKYSKNAA